MGFSINFPQSENSGEYLTVRSAADISGYSQQYLRRLLRKGVFKTRKIGQIWLIDHKDFVNYLNDAAQSDDNRFGPQNSSY